MDDGSFVFLVETGESRTPRLDLIRPQIHSDLLFVHEKWSEWQGPKLQSPLP